MHHHDVYENPSQPDPEVLSATRPPQLNPTICRCRCTRMSEGVSQEGDSGNEDDAASTLVGSDNSQLGDDFPTGSDEAGQHATIRLARPQAPTGNGHVDEFRARIGLSIDVAERFRAGQPLMNMADLSLPPYQLRFPQEYEDTTDSLINEPGSDIHSVVTSGPRSVRCGSPGPGVAYAGAWADETWTERFQLDYHFVVRPLRLSAEHQYCRGLVASHLVLRDEATFMDLGEGLLGGGSGIPSHLQRV